MGNVASQHYDGTRDSPRVDDTFVFARNISETRGILSNASARDGVSSARASVSPRATPVMCSNRLVRNLHPPRAARRLVSTPPRAFSGARSATAFRADKEGAFREPSSPRIPDSRKKTHRKRSSFVATPNSNDCNNRACTTARSYNRDVQQEPRHPLSSPGRADEPRRDQPRAQDVPHAEIVHG